jgi:hypothetical protein
VKLPFLKKKEPQQPSVQQGYQVPQTNQQAGVPPSAQQQQEPAGYQTPRYRGTPVSTPYTVVPPAYDTQVRTGLRKHRLLKLLFVLFGLVLFLSLTAGVYFFIPKNALIVKDQPLGEAIAVKKLILSKDGYLVFHVANKYNKPGNFIAVSDLLLADVYEDFKMDLIKAEYRNRDLVPGDLLFGVIYEETSGDRSFNINQDKVVKDIFGRIIVKEIILQ